MRAGFELDLKRRGREMEGEQVSQSGATKHKTPLIWQESKTRCPLAFMIGQSLCGFGEFRRRRDQGNAPDLDFRLGQGREF
jgi:hypothetical protein